jgi:hypothetical protein
MRRQRTGGTLAVMVIVLAGCATNPGAAVPSATAVASATPSPTFVSSRPPASSPTGSAVPTPTPVPVVLDATGSTTATITAKATTFVPKDGGQARCQSGPDSRAVAVVTALELGELGSGTLRTELFLTGDTTEVFIDGGDLPEGSFLPFWTGTVTFARTDADGMSGTASFRALALEVDAGSKPGTSPLPGLDHWPATLSGTISWTCGAWATPISSDPPPSSAP